jgi:hypothetical protein
MPRKRTEQDDVQRVELPDGRVAYRWGDTGPLYYVKPDVENSEEIAQEKARAWGEQTRGEN